MGFEWPPKGIQFNTQNLPNAHHVIEYAGETNQRTVRICRCWQSRRFPYCDDSHKLLMEAGDSVGPFIARIEPHNPQTSPTRLISTANQSSYSKSTLHRMKSAWVVAPLIFAGYFAVDFYSRIRPQSSVTVLA